MSDVPVQTDLLELDLRRYELRRGGSALKLEKIPMELLILLVQRRDQLVGREEIIARLWGKEVFLDTEQGINTAIRKIRMSLGDDPDQPRFLQTVIGKGYRFVGPVNVVGNTPVVVQPATSDSAVGEETRPIRRSSVPRWKLKVLVAASILIGIAIIAFRYFDWGFWSPHPKVHSIAVLPLENLSGDPSQEYFADGMTDELITHLAQIKSLRVISRTSVMQYKQTRKPLPEIARALEVDAIVEGSVARFADKVRITAQLIDARSDRHVWAEDFEANTGDVLTLQRQIARAITHAVSLNTANVEPSNLNAATRVNSEAYDDYLKCRYFWARRTAVDLQRSVQACEKAVARDPNFAQAWAQLADSYILSAAYAGKRTIDGARLARAAAERAVSLDNGSADAHTAMGMLNEDEWKWQEATLEYETALRLNPNSARAHQLYAGYLSAMGRQEESLRQVFLAQQLDPLSLIIRTNVGMVLNFAHRFEDAAAACRKVLELDPDFAAAHVCLGQSYEYPGRYKEAIAEYKTALSLEGGNPGELPEASKTAVLAHAYAVSGDRRRAQEILRHLESQSHGASYEIACIHAALGNRDRAIEFLNKAYLEHSGELESMAGDPDLDGLRADPRFQELLAKLGLPGAIH